MKYLIHIILLFFVSNAYSAMPEGWTQADQFSQNKANPKVAAYLLGAGNALLTANVILEVEDKELLFCQPSSLVFGYINFVGIIENEIQKFRNDLNDGYKTMRIEHVLLEGLISTFPCENN